MLILPYLCKCKQEPIRTAADGIKTGTNDMATTFRNTMKEIMTMAWQFVKRNGYTMSDALKVAWMNIKLKAQMKKRICKFYFQKVDGSIREAFGTLCESIMPATQGTGRKTNETCQVYFDTEKGEYRCFKKANLLRVA